MNHVQILRNKFENLNSTEIESLDILPVDKRKSNHDLNTTFRRSATLIDFSACRSSDIVKDPVKQNEAAKSESQFQRQNSSCSNSSYKSVRRSPAFRLDEKKKPNLVKSSPVKIHRQHPVNKHKKEIDELEYIATSETIKKILQTPLPPGPPPKKPPRLFNSPNKDINIENEFRKELEDNKLQTVQKSEHFLANERLQNTFPKKSNVTEKTDLKKGISSFLNCIISPCAIDPVYYDQLQSQQLAYRNEHFSEEEIYMEPTLSHVKNETSNNQELHYLCTNILEHASNTPSNETLDLSRCSLESKDSSDFETYEKINILMDFAYDEQHRDNFLAETSGSSTETKPSKYRLSRSLTEKRKNYVRRMTQSITEKDMTEERYGTLKKLPSASSMISRFQHIIDSNSEQNRRASPPKRKGDNAKLFKIALLIGYDVTNKRGYIKSTFPDNEKALPMIEQFIYPTNNNACNLMTKENQNFVIILTDEYGNHLFGYCRQVLAEGMEKCLPLTYCIISHVKATGFYFHVLKEIESRHGYPRLQFNSMMKLLQYQEVPANGKMLYLKLLDSPSPKKAPELTKKPDRETVQKSQQRFNKRLSLESPDWLKNESAKSTSFDMTLINRSLTEYSKRPDEIVIRRSNDVRLEDAELGMLYGSLTSDIMIKIFGTMLIERKVLLLGENISQVSSCVYALYSILYPFQWHHTIISLVPEQIIELLQAPFPFFAGALKSSLNLNILEIEDGIVIDLDTKSILSKCGDESTLLPETLKKSLLLSLKIVDAVDKGKKLANVLIAEAFLQFFVKLFANLDVVNFEKKKFIDSHADQQTRDFLEWFLETVMFKDFLMRKREHEKQRESGSISCHFFDLFNAKVLEKSATLSNHQQRKNVEILMKSNKHKKKNFKDRIKEFLHSN